MHQTNSNSNQLISYFPNVIGAMDGCHLEIELHGEDQYAYYNYLRFHSIHLLAVSLADLRFSYVYVGFPGKSALTSVLKIVMFSSNIYCGLKFSNFL